jgi:hypothetical protein
MAKKKTYYDYLREELGELVDQLQLPELQKKALKRRWLDQVVWADKKADQCRRWHYRLRLTTIVGGVILPALVGINFQLGRDNAFFRTWFPYLPFALSQVIAVSAAAEEFFRYGDRWRDYRKMSEDLKAEGWQYLQLTGPYQYKPSADALETHLKEYRISHASPKPKERQALKLNHVTQTPTTHQESYALFAGRIESIIKNDVQSYITALQQKQVKENQQVQQLLEAANSVAADKSLFAQPEPIQSAPSVTDSPAVHDDRMTVSVTPNGMTSATVTTTPMVSVTLLNTTATPGAAGTLQVNQDTYFKVSPQPSQTLSENQKILVGHGSRFGLVTYSPIENQHLQVTLAQGLGAENRNTWCVYIPHVAIIGNNGQSLPIQPIAVQTPVAQPLPGTTAPPPEKAAPMVATHPAAADLNEAILAATKKLRNMSTHDGPDGGNNACAWTVNKVLEEAGIAPLSNYVPEVVNILKNGRGRRVSREESKAGDLVIAAEERHIGIGLTDGCTRVLSNSSSRACFSWESNTDFDNYYRGSSVIYRLIQ